MKKSFGSNGLSVAMILVGVLILAASGILIGMQVGNSMRQSAYEEELAQKREYEAKAQAEREAALKAAQEAAQAEAAQNPAAPTATPIPADITMTTEQLAAAAEAIKGVGVAGTSVDGFAAITPALCARASMTVISLELPRNGMTVNSYVFPFSVSVRM